MVATFAVTVALGVDLGIFIGRNTYCMYLHVIGLGISLLLVVKHTSYPHVSILGRTKQGKYLDITLNPDTAIIPVRINIVIIN